MKHLFAFLFLLGITFSLSAQSVRERILLDDGWQFAFGNASSPEKDFGCGTEYFNYLTKAASIHNEGPYSPKFNPEKWGVDWKTVNLPHDWVVDLPYAKEASHSHGYKAVGYKFPENSVGWYRKSITVPQEDLGKHLYLQFDGIFRDARIWINGFYLGHEPSGYATQVYDITEYLNYGEENLICVRADATLEEGWFYEGAGIYRHVWLNKTAPLHVAPFGVFVSSTLEAPFDKAVLVTEVQMKNSGKDPVSGKVWCRLLDADGQVQMEDEAEEIDDELVPVELPDFYKRIFRHPYLQQRGFCFDDYEYFPVGITGRLNPRYADYVTFPVIDCGMVVGYVSRHIWPKEAIDTYNRKTKYKGEYKILRYRNSTENDFFKLLYNYDAVREDGTDTVIVAEGVFDVIALTRKLELYDNPHIAAVATFGKKISDVQIYKLQSKGVRTVVIGYDGDAVEAVKRAAERLRPYFEVFIADIADADKDWEELAETEVYGIFAYRLLSVLEYKLKKVQER